MANDLEILKRARNFFQKNDSLFEIQNTFASILALLRIEIALTKKDELKKIHALLYQAIFDLQNIGTTIHRLEWVRRTCISKDEISNLWMPYGSTEIEFFHVQLRSIMDYISEAVLYFSEKRGQVREGSFRRLFQWIEKEEKNRGKLGNELSEIVLSASWFSHLRLVRDDIVHYGAQTLVFGDPKDGIIFQIFDRNDNNLIAYNYLMINANAAYFDRYAAIYLSRILCFLEDLAEYMKMKLGIQDGPGKASIGSIGFSIIFNWIDNLINIIEKDVGEVSFGI